MHAIVWRLDKARAAASAADVHRLASLMRAISVLRHLTNEYAVVARAGVGRSGPTPLGMRADPFARSCARRWRGSPALKSWADARQHPPIACSEGRKQVA